MLNNIYKWLVQRRPQLDLHCCKDVLALCVVAVLLAIIMGLLNLYLELDATCLPLEVNAQVSEIEKIAELERKEWLSNIVDRKENDSRKF